MHHEHIILFYDLRVQVYTDAAKLGISVAAVAEFMLERWWCVWAEANSVETIECVALSERSAPRED